MKLIANSLFIGLACLALAASIAAIAFGIWGDFSVNYGHDKLIAIAKNTQWESIAAGLLGLGGGLFVISSTRKQIEASNEVARKNEIHNKEMRVLEICLPIENLKYMIDDVYIFLFASLQRIDKLNNEHKIDDIIISINFVKSKLRTYILYFINFEKKFGPTHFNVKIIDQINIICACQENPVMMTECTANNATQQANQLAHLLKILKQPCTTAIIALDEKIQETEERYKSSRFKNLPAVEKKTSIL
ncbi:hypothetical protein ACFOY8_04430 [Thalassospira xianhensis]|uniref:Uncharacterized protein n=1 Tax=Thalassospira xianhensis MCCC 1A02616 TaxID=1177929 RepID=A0A367U6D5_9PROT|nr:hypothetical protein [Thalassospira xianhensis]RCK03768.1 hypothetical protein TH5_23575 [Thalassospira xianhensis MCCC 1A02616]